MAAADLYDRLRPKLRYVANNEGRRKHVVQAAKRAFEDRGSLPVLPSLCEHLRDRGATP